MGGGKRGDRKRDSQGSRKQEKFYIGKIMQNFAIKKSVEVD